MTSTEVREPKDFGDSSPDDPCGACGHALKRHPWDKIHGSADPERDKLVRVFRMLCMDCAVLDEPPVPWAHDYEPRGSASSPPDERCTGSLTGKHCPYHVIGDPCCHCGAVEPVPAAGGTAGTPECPHSWRYDSDADADRCGLCGAVLTPAESETAGEPEALVCSHDHWERDAHDIPQRCRDCGFEPESPGSPPRRPPYAVAYAVQGGAQYEIALPGDATVRAIDGALIITHDSAVLALTSVRPMEEQ